MRVFFTNLGCKLNQAEIERLARDFENRGDSIVGSLEEADLHVVNSCTVTHLAARDSRKIARRAERRNLGARTVLTGCYATGSSKEAASLAGVDLVVDNHHKHDLVAIVDRELPELRTPEPDSRPLPRTDSVVPVSYAGVPFGAARAALKIEDGCNMSCSFCIIPSTRGRQRSLDPDDVICELRELVRRGHREVVVTGVQISSYRSQGLRLVDLVRRLLDETDVERLRLSSIAPWQFDEALLDLFSTDRICRHFHFSLQSGCDETLRRMRRPYSAQRFSLLLEQVRAEISGVAITTDVIVGFPGESEREFDESQRFVSDCGFAKCHVFKYSSRPGTRAADLPGHVSPQVKQQRVHEMLEVARRGAREFLWRQVGSEVDVLWEDRRDGEWRGTSDNYIRVLRRTGSASAGVLERTRLGEPNGAAMLERLPGSDVEPRVDVVHLAGDAGSVIG